MTIQKPIINSKGRQVAKLFIPTRGELTYIKNQEKLAKELKELEILKRDLKNRK